MRFTTLAMPVRIAGSCIPRKSERSRAAGRPFGMMTSGSAIVADQISTASEKLMPAAYQRMSATRSSACRRRPNWKDSGNCACCTEERQRRAHQKPDGQVGGLVRSSNCIGPAGRSIIDISQLGLNLASHQTALAALHFQVRHQSSVSCLVGIGLRLCAFCLLALVAER